MLILNEEGRLFVLMSTVYHVNFHSESYRSSRPSNNVRFGASDDSAAAAVAAELANWTAGRQTSLYGTTFFNNVLGYPLGTRLSAAAIASDATFGVWKVRARNVKLAATELDIATWILGATGLSGLSAGFTALGAAPSIPGGNILTAVSGVVFTSKF